MKTYFKEEFRFPNNYCLSMYVLICLTDWARLIDFDRDTNPTNVLKQQNSVFVGGGSWLKESSLNNSYIIYLDNIDRCLCNQSSVSYRNY